MTRILSRRVFLRGGLAGLGAAVLGGAAHGEALARSPIPLPRPARGGERAARAIEDYLAKARLSGDISASVGDPSRGGVLEGASPARRMPPASTAKAITALYALETLGADFRFVTRVFALGTVTGGRLDGDLVLVGGGDPGLDTDGLAAMAIALRESGIIEVTGALRVEASALPTLYQIDPGQLVHAGYNPAVAGLNLNYNRVHFEWRREGQDYSVTMQARTARQRPPVQMARMAIEPRALPVFTLEDTDGIERWTVAKDALGSGGARWLPVRHPTDYAAEVFQTMLRANGIVVKRGPDLTGLPEGASELARVESEPLEEIVRDMLKYSTNLTAEVIGLTATRSRGGDITSLAASAAAMNDWARDALGAWGPQLVDHSGLGEDSRISSADMVQILMHPTARAVLPPLLKEIPATDELGRRDDGVGYVIRAKTGTLDFVSALAGYVTTPEGHDLAFAVMSGDLERRTEAHKRGDETPPGARSWTRRARLLQQDLVRRWSAVYGQDA